MPDLGGVSMVRSNGWTICVDICKTSFATSHEPFLCAVIGHANTHSGLLPVQDDRADSWLRG